MLQKFSELIHVKVLRTMPELVLYRVNTCEKKMLVTINILVNFSFLIKWEVVNFEHKILKNKNHSTNSAYGP